MLSSTIAGGRPTAPVFEAMLAKYDWVWIGVTVGFAAKYALLIKKGVKVRPWLVFADILLLPLLALADRHHMDRGPRPDQQQHRNGMR